jgi:hypothetical protein
VRTKISYPIRLEKDIIERMRAIARKEKRTIKAQIEMVLLAALSGQKP